MLCLQISVGPVDQQLKEQRDTGEAQSNSTAARTAAGPAAATIGGAGTSRQEQQPVPAVVGGAIAQRTVTWKEDHHKHGRQSLQMHNQQQQQQPYQGYFSEIGSPSNSRPSSSVLSPWSSPLPPIPSQEISSGVPQRPTSNSAPLPKFSAQEAAAGGAALNPLLFAAAPAAAAAAAAASAFNAPTKPTRGKRGPVTARSSFRAFFGGGGAGTAGAPAGDDDAKSSGSEGKASAAAVWVKSLFTSGQGRKSGSSDGKRRSGGRNEGSVRGGAPAGTRAVASFTSGIDAAAAASAAGGVGNDGNRSGRPLSGHQSGPLPVVQFSVDGGPADVDEKGGGGEQKDRSVHGGSMNRLPSGQQNSISGVAAMLSGGMLKVGSPPRVQPGMAAAAAAVLGGAGDLGRVQRPPAFGTSAAGQAHVASPSATAGGGVGVRGVVSLDIPHHQGGFRQQVGFEPVEKVGVTGRKSMPGPQGLEGHYKRTSAPGMPATVRAAQLLGLPGYLPGGPAAGAGAAGGGFPGPSHQHHQQQHMQGLGLSSSRTPAMASHATHRMSMSSFKGAGEVEPMGPPSSSRGGGGPGMGIHRASLPALNVGGPMSQELAKLLAAAQHQAPVLLPPMPAMGGATAAGAAAAAAGFHQQQQRAEMGVPAAEHTQPHRGVG